MRTDTRYGKYLQYRDAKLLSLISYFQVEKYKQILRTGEFLKCLSVPGYPVHMSQGLVEALGLVGWELVDQEEAETFLRP